MSRALLASFALWLVASLVVVMVFVALGTDPDSPNADNGDGVNGVAYGVVLTIGCLPLYAVCFMYWRKLRPPIDSEPQKWKRIVYVVGFVLGGLWAVLMVVAVGATEGGAGLVSSIAWTVLAVPGFLVARHQLRAQSSSAAQTNHLEKAPPFAPPPPPAPNVRPAVQTAQPSEPPHDSVNIKPDPVEPDPAPRTRVPSSRSHDYEVGDVIGDRFEVEELLGAGGFSKVYRVTDTLEGAERALKLFDSAAGFEAVRREIGALRKARHPRIVEVFWFDSTTSGEWYLVMEFVQGELLADYVVGDKQMTDRQAVDIAVDVLDALIAIHPDSVRLDELDQKKREGEISVDEYDEMMMLSENALVHRDVKPQNIMLTRAGAKLLDFNIASRVGDPVRTVSGTPPYQPPDADLTLWDVSTDLFAVGVTLYELVCDGNHPYPGGRPMGGVEPRHPSQFRRDLPDSLSRFLVKACAPSRSERFSTASEMRAALAQVRSTL
jgi:tRNA A-37 threonylcarbamoyl transferase component Bud32